MSVYGYCRVSTRAQAADGESLAVQRRQIEGWAQIVGVPVTEVFVERGVSGSVPLNQRPEGTRLLEGLRAGDIVIAAKMDRMFRSALDALTVIEVFKKHRVTLHLVDLGGDVVGDGNGHAKLVFTILSAVAEAERDRIRERVTTAKADCKRRGMYLGGAVPFGYAVGDDDKLVPVPEEQEALRQMLELREAGYSLRGIAKELGLSLSPDAVKRALARAAELQEDEAA